ncbi:MAG: FHA domain-containing protein [Symploca sp. SIO2G7]|nr:FHA domain-containing protein [Symploca sp. SIO2G7]
MGQYLQFGDQRFDLSKSKIYRIGRDLDNDIVILARGVSRLHCIINISEMLGRKYISDGDGLSIASRNGTFVNGKKYRLSNHSEHDRSKILEHGDQIEIGLALLFYIETSSFDKNEEIDSDVTITPECDGY